MGLSFDSWMYFHQLPQLLNLAKKVPDLPIMVDHIGGMLLVGKYRDKKRRSFRNLKKKHF